MYVSFLFQKVLAGPDYWRDRTTENWITDIFLIDSTVYKFRRIVNTIHQETVSTIIFINNFLNLLKHLYVYMML